MTPEDPLRVLLVDDHELFRTGLRAHDFVLGERFSIHYGDTRWTRLLSDRVRAVNPLVSAELRRWPCGGGPRASRSGLRDGGASTRGGLAAFGGLALESALDVGGLFGALGRCLRSRPPLLP